mmetsp:Transcript_215/g.376  ORF Transcript_215/g.376 Transcript_215/m.376 type:complete len:227 (-) Transcript_215:52-732(-)
MGNGCTSMNVLSSEFRSLVLCVAHTASSVHNAQVMISEFRSLSIPLGRRKGADALLQTSAFIGFPKVLQSFSLLHAESLLPNDTTKPVEATEAFETEEIGVFPHQSAASGQILFEQMNGNKSKKLQSLYHAFHPQLDHLYIEFACGRLMSSNVFSVREKELLAVAALSEALVSPVLLSHIRGALRNGSSRSEVESVLECAGSAFGQSAAERRQAMWMTFDRARYDL